MQFQTSLVQPRLGDRLVQICAFHVKVLAKVGDSIEAPLSNDGASVAMTTPFNREKLESLAFLGPDGTGVVAARNFPADLTLFHGPNVRFAICMDGAGNAADAQKIKTDKLGVQTVIYANTSASLGELMLENGRRRTTPLRLTARSADEKVCNLVLEVTPHGKGEHYSSANMAHVEKISAQHLPMPLIAQALEECLKVRSKAVVDYMQTQGVHEKDSSTFYMTLPMGSLYDITMPENGLHRTSVDISQWQALVSKTSSALAESHTPKLCEALVNFLTHSVAGEGVDIENAAEVRAYVQRAGCSKETRSALLRGFLTSLQKTNEGSFQYTSDSQVKGFAVLNTVHGLRLEAQFDSNGEKQNLFGMDPLTSNLSLERNTALFAARAEQEYHAAMAGDESARDAATLAYSQKLTAITAANSEYKTLADCEDGATTLAAQASVANLMDCDHMAACISQVFASGMFSTAASGLEQSVKEVALVLHHNMHHLHVGLCFAHAASAAQMKGTQVESKNEGLIKNYENMCAQVNKRELNGHACLFDTTDSARPTSLDDSGWLQVSAGPTSVGASGLLQVSELTKIEAWESTNPIQKSVTDPRCSFTSSSSLPKLEEQLVALNGQIPTSFAKSIVSEISAKGAQNITGCVAGAVTYTSMDSPFYHTLIAGNGYAYTSQNGKCLPTCHVSTLGDASAKHFMIRGALLPDVIIRGNHYTEDELLNIVVGSASCLAPSLDRILRTRSAAGFHVYARSPPDNSDDYTRVVMRGRMTPMTGPLSEALHVAEEHARQTAAQQLHPNAVAVSSNSQTWNIYLPHSSDRL